MHMGESHPWYTARICLAEACTAAAMQPPPTKGPAARIATRRCSARFRVRAAAGKMVIRMHGCVPPQGRDRHAAAGIAGIYAGTPAEQFPLLTDRPAGLHMKHPANLWDMDIKNQAHAQRHRRHADSSRRHAANRLYSKCCCGVINATMHQTCGQNGEAYNPVQRACSDHPCHCAALVCLPQANRHMHQCTQPRCVGSHLWHDTSKVFLTNHTVLLATFRPAACSVAFQ